MESTLRNNQRMHKHNWQACLIAAAVAVAVASPSMAGNNDNDPTAFRSTPHQQWVWIDSADKAEVLPEGVWQQRTVEYNRTSHLIGESVYAADGRRFGKLTDVVFLHQDGRVITYGVVEHGGFFGFGEREIVIPWASFSKRDNAKGLALPYTHALLRDTPEFDPARTDGDSFARIDNHFAYTHNPYVTTDAIDTRDHSQQPQMTAEQYYQEAQRKQVGSGAWWLNDNTQLSTTASELNRQTMRIYNDGLDDSITPSQDVMAIPRDDIDRPIDDTDMQQPSETDGE